MYEVRVETRFSAAHQIRLHDGQVEPMHGHDWKVQALFRGPKLDEIGILIDFVWVEKALQEIVSQFEKTNINDSPLLEGRNPTAENIAHCLYNQLHRRLGENVPLAAVLVTEAPGCTAGYWQSML